MYTSPLINIRASEDVYDRFPLGLNDTIHVSLWPLLANLHKKVSDGAKDGVILSKTQHLDALISSLVVYGPRGRRVVKFELKSREYCLSLLLSLSFSLSFFLSLHPVDCV